MTGGPRVLHWLFTKDHVAAITRLVRIFQGGVKDAGGCWRGGGHLWFLLRHGAAFHEGALLRRQPIKGIDLAVDERIRRADLAVQRGLLVRCLGGGTLLMQAQHLLHQRHDVVMRGLIGLVLGVDDADGVWS